MDPVIAVSLVKNCIRGDTIGYEYLIHYKLINY